MTHMREGAGRSPPTTEHARCFFAFALEIPKDELPRSTLLDTSDDDTSGDEGKEDDIFMENQDVIYDKGEYISTRPTTNDKKGEGDEELLEFLSLPCDSSIGLVPLGNSTGDKQRIQGARAPFQTNAHQRTYNVPLQTEGKKFYRKLTPKKTTESTATREAGARGPCESREDGQQKCKPLSSVQNAKDAILKLLKKVTRLLQLTAMNNWFGCPEMKARCHRLGSVTAQATAEANQMGEHNCTTARVRRGQDMDPRLLSNCSPGFFLKVRRVYAWAKIFALRVLIPATANALDKIAKLAITIVLACEIVLGQYEFAKLLTDEIHVTYQYESLSSTFCNVMIPSHLKVQTSLCRDQNVKKHTPQLRVRPFSKCVKVNIKAQEFYQLSKCGAAAPRFGPKHAGAVIGDNLKLPNQLYQKCTTRGPSEVLVVEAGNEERDNMNTFPLQYFVYCEPRDVNLHGLISLGTEQTNMTTICHDIDSILSASKSMARGLWDKWFGPSDPQVRPLQSLNFMAECYEQEKEQPGAGKVTCKLMGMYPIGLGYEFILSFASIACRRDRIRSDWEKTAWRMQRFNVGCAHVETVRYVIDLLIAAQKNHKIRAAAASREKGKLEDTPLLRAEQTRRMLPALYRGLLDLLVRERLSKHTGSDKEMYEETMNSAAGLLRKIQLQEQESLKSTRSNKRKRSVE